jgi:acyl-CoA thioesterase
MKKPRPIHDPHISLEELQRYFAKDAFARLCGIEICDAGPGYAKTRVSVEDRHLNSLQMTHGGVLFTLADMAFAAAAHTRGRSAVAINTTISFVKAGKADTLTAEAQEISRNQKLATYTVQVTDSAGNVLALFQGMAYIKAEHISLGKE